MADPIFSDPSLAAGKLALDGLARRQEMIGRNLVNVDTPGYQAQTVNFEAALRRAVNGNQPFQFERTHAAHLALTRPSPAMQSIARPGGSMRADGNNVDIDVELTEMAETGIRYQALTQLVSKRLLLLKTIANAR